MNLKRLTSRAKDLVDKRGGPDSVKQDAGELKDIAAGKGPPEGQGKGRRRGDQGAGCQHGIGPAPETERNRIAAQGRLSTPGRTRTSDCCLESSADANDA